VMGGEVGRTPDSVAGGRDGRDHYPDGFSWAMVSINQPAFKTNAVGDTGPNGMWQIGNAQPLVDPIYPGVFGGLVYRSMGFPIGANSAYDIPASIGSRPPADATMATSPTRGHATWLMEQLGPAR